MKPTIIAALIASFISVDALAEIPYVFASGDKASASEVNDNFSHLLSLNSDMSLLISVLNTQLVESKETVVILDEKVSKFDEDSITFGEGIAKNIVDINGLSDSLAVISQAAEVANENSLIAISTINEVNNSLSNVSFSVTQIENNSVDISNTINELSTDMTELNANSVTVNTTIDNMQTSLNTIVLGSVCTGDGLSDTGVAIDSYVYTSTYASAGDGVQLDGVLFEIYELPYWSEYDDIAYSIVLPLGVFTAYTNSSQDNPCNNAVISDLYAKVNLITNVEYKIRSSEVDAVITTSINAKIKDVHTVFDLSYSVSDTVSLGGVSDTATFNIQNSINEIKNDHEASLLSMLDNVTITALP
ncbi:MAG: hypothetical protein ACI87J_002502 [Colwellia sp.]|jgi:hypothetical protein